MKSAEEVQPEGEFASKFAEALTILPILQNHRMPLMMQVLKMTMLCLTLRSE